MGVGLGLCVGGGGQWVGGWAGRQVAVGCGRAGVWAVGGQCTVDGD